MNVLQNDAIKQRLEETETQCKALTTSLIYYKEQTDMKNKQVKHISWLVSNVVSWSV